MEKQNEPTYEVKVNKQHLVQQIADKAITDLLTALVPDETGKKMITGVMTIFRKHGIDPITSMKIITEMGEMFMEVNNESDR
jgi:hypothetical protein